MNFLQDSSTSLLQMRKFLIIGQLTRLFDANKLNNWTPDGKPSKNFENRFSVKSGFPNSNAFLIIIGLILLKISFARSDLKAGSFNHSSDKLKRYQKSHNFQLLVRKTFVLFHSPTIIFLLSSSTNSDVFFIPIK